MESIEYAFVDKSALELPTSPKVPKDGVVVIGESEVYDKNSDYTPQQTEREAK